MLRLIFKIKDILKGFIKIIIMLTVFKGSLIASCSATNSQAFTVNELNTFSHWVELYANPQNIQSPVTNWSVTVCTSAGCETQYFDFDINNGSFFLSLNGYTQQWHKTSLDILIKDEAGNAVNYFNLAYIKSGGTKITTQEQEAIDCGLDLACNYFTHSNNGERNLSRDPDGGCVLVDESHNKDTKDGSNNPEGFIPINVSISDISILEGHTGLTQFTFNLQIDPITFFGIPIYQPRHTADIYITYSTREGTATIADNDYIPVSNASVVIVAGQSSASITIDVIGDLNVELNETFFIDLHAISVGSFSDNEAIGAIINDDFGGGIYKNGLFNAVDLVASCEAQVHWNNKLQTKIVNDDISLSILALDKATNLPLEANITKVSLVHYPSGNNNACTGVSIETIDVCSNCGLTDINGCLSLSVNKSFNQRASQCVEILIQGKDKEDIIGTSLSDSNSSDNLAIRPDTYNCDGIVPSVLISEHNYSSTFKAIPLNLTSPSIGYTSNNVLLSAKKYMRTGDLNISLNGSLSSSGLNFVDGNASVDLIFNDVGDIGIDLNDSVWSNVDSDDTAEIDRVIHTECRRIFRADHFEVVLSRPVLENNASTGFTYLSNLSPSLKMSAWMKGLDVIISAKGENNATMLNYKAPNTDFYGNDVFLSPLVTLPTKHSSATKLPDVMDQNSSDIASFIFIDGEASYSYENLGFNYDRDFSSPITPFGVDGNESLFSVRVEDKLYTSVTGSASTDSDNNVSFYYGRLHPSDLITTRLLSNANIVYEVYDNTNSSYTGGMKQSSLFWFINNLHNNQNEGNITLATASSDTLIDNAFATFFSFSYNAPSSGRENLGIDTASSSRAFIHLSTQQWLWYVPSDFGSAYNDSSGSDCTMHPCFTYTFDSLVDSKIIESGEFNGTIVPIEERGNYQKQGVKLFR